MKRQRGRGRKSGSPSNRSYESNGPDVKVRGTPSHIYDKYMQLARDASSSGDRVMAENYYQHAEHYLRIVQANQPKREEREERDDRDEAELASDETASENQTEAAEAGSEEQAEQPRQRRGRGRRRKDADQPAPEGSDDPLQVVDPEAGEAVTKSDNDEGEKPRKRTRTRRPKADAAAQSALDSVDAKSEQPSEGGNAGEAA